MGEGFLGVFAEMRLGSLRSGFFRVTLSCVQSEIRTSASNEFLTATIGVDRAEAIPALFIPEDKAKHRPTASPRTSVSDQACSFGFHICVRVLSLSFRLRSFLSTTRSEHHRERTVESPGQSPSVQVTKRIHQVMSDAFARTRIDVMPMAKHAVI